MTRRQLSLRLLSITRRVLPPLAASIAARIVFLMSGIALFALGGWAVAALASGDSAWGIALVIACAVSLSLLKGLARYLEQFAGHFVAFHSLAMLRNYFYDQLEPQAPAGTDRLDSGDIMNRVTKDIDRVEVFFAHTLAPVTTAIIVPILSVVWMGAAVSWTLAAVLAPFLLVVGAVVPFLGSRSTARAARELREARGAIAAHVTDSVQGVREVLAFGAEDRREAEMSAIEERISAAMRTQGRWIALRRGFNQAAVALGVVTVAMVAGSDVLAGSLTLPQAGMAVGVALGAFGPVLAVEEFAADLDQAFASAARVFAITDRAPVVSDPAEPKALTAGDIEITDVTFSYPVEGDEALPAPTVLNGVSIHIPAGKRTAIVGASGSGKSTLATLIARFADPDAGAVRIGGVDLRDMDEPTLYSTVSFVLQDAQLLGTTVRENIALGRPDADLEQVRDAARVAHIDEEIMALSEGYDTVLGQDTALSGGQEQRIAIARAILLDTPVILLDEATAMADPESEAEIQEALSALVEDRTVLVIAHRPAAVRGADRIVVMERGRIVASGSHDDLVDEPHYRALLRQTGELGDVSALAGHGPVAAPDGPTRAGAGSKEEPPAALGPDAGVEADRPRPVPPVLTPEVETSRGASSLLARFRRLMLESSWRQTRGCLVLAVANGIASGAALVSLLPASVALGSGAPRWGLSFGGWLVTFGICGVVAAVTEFQGQRRGMSGALGFMHDVHHAVGDRIARLPLRWFNADSAGTLSRAVSQEMVALGESAAHFMYMLTSTSAACVVVWAGSWAWDWRLGLLLTVAAPLFAGLVRAARRLLDHGKSVSEPAERELATRIVEIARCQGALRSCRAATGYSRLASAFDDGARASRRSLWWETAGNVVNGALSQVIVVAMIALTASYAVSGTMEPLVAVAIIGMCLRFTTMLDDIGASVMGLEERRQMMNHLDAVMDAELMAEPEARAMLPDPGAVELNDVVFGYRADEPVLGGVSMNVPARSMCAIVGPSGSGKTTIARLIARFWDTGSGTVRVSGTDVRDMPTAQLMEQLSMVFQDVYLFDDTLDANVRIGDPAADDEQVRWAADLAGVTEIVNRLPHGWSTRVGEGGRALSGGERQRVSIARALLKRAPIVLLDEATSALDAENEANIVAAMQELRRTSTLIVIAHKLETIAAADQVIVLDDAGQVAQCGSHENLVEVDGPYRSFWEQRTRARGWALVSRAE